MLKLIIAGLGFTLAVAITEAGQAANMLKAAPEQFSLVQTIGEGCGANAWRDRNGNCHPFTGPGGSNRGTVIECPPGTHIDDAHRRCLPNRY